MKRFKTAFKDRLPSVVKDSLKYVIPRKLINKARSNEVYFVSFPKCGRSWLKLMICDIVYRQFPNFKRFDDVSTHLLYKVNTSIPRIIFTHDGNPMYKLPSELSENKSFYKYARVVLLVRDPRDVMVSWFYEYKNRVGQESKRKEIKDSKPSDFIHNEVGGLKTLVSFYNIWWDQQSLPKDFLLVRYEDLRKDTFLNFNKILQFLGFSDKIHKSTIRDAIEHNNFLNTQKREKKGEIKLGKLVKNEFGSEGPQKEDYLKARKGKVGGFNEIFSSEEIAFMNNYIKANLNPGFKY